ncbi:MAG: hypothetical protein ACTSP4_06250 [Candidatus Hodarchaeales archaeon]
MLNRRVALEAKVGDFLKRWKNCQINSMKTVNILFSVISKMNLVRADKSVYDNLGEFPDLEKKLIFSLIEQINGILPELEKNLNSFRLLFEKYSRMKHTIHESFRYRMKNMNSIDPDYLNNIRLLEEALDRIDEIYDMVEIEYLLKKRVIKELHGLLNNKIEPVSTQRISIYLTIWSSEPYLNYSRVNDILETFQYLMLSQL